MKKIKSTLLAALIAMIALPSCNYTELDPTDMVPPERALGTVENVGKAVVGIYGMASLRTKLGVAEYIADDCVQGGDSGGAGTDLTNLVYVATSGEVSGLWSHYYGLINQCNRVIYYGAKLQPADDAQAASLDNSFGAAYFFRAYAHFELLCFFSDFSDDKQPGIPYVSHYHVVGNPGRDAVGSCFDQIMTDLNRAYDKVSLVGPNLASNNKQHDSPAYLSKAAVDALRARVSLYHKKYTHAYIYASNALRAVKIAPMEDVQNVWLDKTNSGIIFKLSRPAGTTTIGTMFVGQDYSSIFRPSTNLTTQTYPAEDVRTGVFYRMGHDRAGAAVMMATKWFGDAADIGREDEKMFRAEEMQLIAAEALTLRENPELGEASQLLNALRAERIGGYTAQNYTQASVLMTQLALERRRELVYEGHRLFDARRLNLEMQREGTSIMVSDYRRILPIPQAEIDANEGLSAADQNFGY